jgi:murein DD-endopeptidase MepM/ murein hydrolase activator NlpD
MGRILFLVLAFFATPALAQSPGVRGGPVDLGPMDHNVDIEPAYRAALTRARSLGLDRVRPHALPAPTLGYPLRLRPNSKAAHSAGISNFVDLDSSGSLREFTCGRRTYDGHQGIDIATWPFAWTMMDRREVEIIAAAPGTIISSHDGEFDRQCGLNQSQANHVIIRQGDGVDAFYWHMKRGSVTSKPVSARVARGEYLGLVASSGNSTGPHLHFELSAGNNTVDPYAGACGDRRTSWQHQHEDAHTDLLRIATHSAQPSPNPIACGRDGPTGYANRFGRGDTVWLAAYVRDQRSNTPVRFTVMRPNGTTLGSWTSGTPPAGQVYPFAYWLAPFNLPLAGARGQWTARVTLAGRSMEHIFVVGPMPRPTRLATVARPRADTAAPTAPATFNVTTRNAGANEAIGCTLMPDAPLAAQWFYQRLAGGSPTGRRNEAFNLAPGARVTHRLTIRPKRGYRARQIAVPIRVSCTNASAPAAKAGINVVTLSF